MDRIYHFLSSINTQADDVRPLWGRRFVALDIATILGLRRSPTVMCYILESIEADIQKGLAELKELV